MNCTAAIGHQLLATSTPKLRQQEQSTRPDPLLHMPILIIPELLLITVVKANATGDGCIHYDPFPNSGAWALRGTLPLHWDGHLSASAASPFWL